MGLRLRDSATGSASSAPLEPSDGRLRRIFRFVWVCVASLMLVQCTSARPVDGATPLRVSGSRLTGLTIPSWSADGYRSAELSSILDSTVGLGLKRVTFIVTWYQSSIDANTFGPTDATPTDDALLWAMAQARQRGLAVSLKPHVDLPNDQWRGEIRPADRATWFATYQQFVLRYARLAQQGRAATFVVGTELSEVSTDPRWNDVITTVRSAFSGRVTYAANWDEAPRVSFWNKLDEIGIDAYYPLRAIGDSPTAPVSVEQLVEGWKEPLRELRALSIKWRKPVRFTEVGYTRRTGTTATPWDFALVTPVSDSEQAVAYEALFRAVGTQSWFIGPDFWASDPPSEDHDEFGYSPLGHPAADALAGGAKQLLIPQRSGSRAR